MRSAFFSAKESAAVGPSVSDVDDKR